MLAVCVTQLFVLKSAAPARKEEKRAQPPPPPKKSRDGEGRGPCHPRPLPRMPGAVLRRGVASLELVPAGRVAFAPPLPSPRLPGPLRTPREKKSQKTKDKRLELGEEYPKIIKWQIISCENTKLDFHL